MKIYLFKKENDEEVYYKVDDVGFEYILNFERIKELSKIILDNKFNGKEVEFDVTVQDNSLDIYKTTLDNVFKSINDDNELFELYKENKNSDDNENSEECTTEEEITVEVSSNSDDL